MSRHSMAFWLALALALSGPPASAQPTLDRKAIPQDAPPEVRQLLEQCYAGAAGARGKAADDLGDLTGAAAPAVAHLLSMLGDEEGYAQTLVVGRMKITGFTTPAGRAAVALGKIGGAAIEPLLTLLGNRSHPHRHRAALALGVAREGRAVPLLIQALGDDDARLRAAAAGALAGLKDRRAVEPLIAALGDREQDVSREARTALEALTGQSFGDDAARWEVWVKAHPDALPAGPERPAGAVPDASGTPEGAVPRPLASSPPPRELYSQAYADFSRGDYDLAIQGFQEYMRGYPGTDLVDNAQFWVGECRYMKREYEVAIEAWDALLRDHPASDKRPDAHLKKGRALEKLGRVPDAQAEYRFVVDRFPDSVAAQLARRRLGAEP